MQQDASPARERYRTPPAEVVRILDAPPTPWVLANAAVRSMLFVEHPALPALPDVARPSLRLAGLRIDPTANAHHQTVFGTGLCLRDRDGSEVRRIELPPGRRISAVRWSHTGRRFACVLVGGGGSELAIGSVADARLSTVVTNLHAVFGDGFAWMPDGERLVATIVPAGRGPAPAAPPIATGPIVHSTAGDVSPLRTYQDLLASPHDEDLFEHHATSQLVVIDPRESGSSAPAQAIETVGAPGLILAFDVAPGGEHVLVSRVERPYSYLHDVFGFPHAIEVWDREGACIHTVARVPLAENIPIEGVRLGPRSVTWSPHEPATLVWVEALDDGDPRKKVLHRDRWLELAAPFTDEPREVVRLEHRASGLSWLPDASTWILREYDRERRWTRAAIRSRRDPAFLPVVLDDRSLRDHYADPGTWLVRPDTRGRRLVRQEGTSIFRSGEGEAPGGSRPFLDRQDLGSLRTERLWTCPEGEYETLVALVEEEGRATGIVTRHESPRDPPNLRLARFKAERGGRVSPSFRWLTDFLDPAPELRAIEKRLLTYERADGVALSGTLYLPPGYVEGTRLPLVLWAYPHDYVDAGTAGQVRGTPHRFTRIEGASHLFFLTQGYAVLDAASMPVVGDPETMNDTFLEQIVAGAQAAIDKAVELGVADRERVGVGGHSYGGFMTANLLAHSDLFRAGIARSGAYNRTLTPFGFQSERRTLWQAKDVYTRLSPFHHADTIRAPLLLIHGAEDNNPGTFPIQSERLFHAIKGNGGTARYVVLPHETHAYRARESVLHVLAEMIEWFDRYVKRAEPRDPT